MLAIVDEIEREGFKVLDQTVYLKPFMPKVGCFQKYNQLMSNGRIFALALN